MPNSAPQTKPTETLLSPTTSLALLLIKRFGRTSALKTCTENKWNKTREEIKALIS